MTVERDLLEAFKASPVYVEDVFSTYLYTGTGATQTITNNINLSGKGGLVWTGGRSNAWGNNLFDTDRGATNLLQSQSTNPQSTDATTLTAFNSDGFSLGTSVGVNNNTNTYVARSFRKQAKFFDIVTYTGTGSARTISHNLGCVPGLIIVKSTSNISASWTIYHKGLTSASYYMEFNAAVGQTSDTTVWNATAPTSSVFSVGTSSKTNFTGGATNYVAYLFADTSSGGFGLSGTDSITACGSVTTNGSGLASVSLGWEPQYIMIAPTNSGTWYLIDTMRGFTTYPRGTTTYNGLYAQSSAAEFTDNSFILTNQGFDINYNANTTYVYLAIRRGPMKTPTSGTSVYSPISASSATGTQATTNFPVDLQIKTYRTVSDTNRFAVDDRLRGVSTRAGSAAGLFLKTTSNATEDTTSLTTLYWNNTGYQIADYYGGTSTIYWNFARAPGFMDVVCYTGASGTQTIAHNLGAVPQLIITKNRKTAGYSWFCYSQTTGADKRLILNSTGSQATDTSVWNNTAPTSSNFFVGSTNTNNSGSNYVAYLFATVSGVSKVGSYTGTADALNIDCGFAATARFIMIKRTDGGGTGGWYVWDSARGIAPSGSNEPYFEWQSTSNQVSADYIGTYSAGFALTSSAPAELNANGGTYIYLAIA